jgi:hypothetical protein
LPSTIVTVTALVVFACSAGDMFPAAAWSTESVGAAGCGTDTSSGAFFCYAQICRRHRDRLASRRIIADYGPQHEKAEEQAERHRDDLRRRDVDRAPAAPGTLPERRCQISRSHPASRPRVASRQFC